MILTYRGGRTITAGDSMYYSCRMQRHWLGADHLAHKNELQPTLNLFLGICIYIFFCIIVSRRQTPLSKGTVNWVKVMKEQVGVIY